MANLLRVDSSAGGSRSVSKRLGDLFQAKWLHARPGACSIEIDLVATPPPVVSGPFVIAAYTPPDNLSDEDRGALSYSDAALAAIAGADALLITTPMYNFGLPGALKAWFDQIIRIGISFGTTEDPERPYVPLLPNRPVFVITARGSADMIIGGGLPELDFLSPHLRTLLAFIGFSDPMFFDMIGTESPRESWEHQYALICAELTRAATHLEGHLHFTHSDI